MNINGRLINWQGLRAYKAASRAPCINFEKTGTRTWLVVCLWFIALLICTVVLNNWLLLEEIEAKTVLVEDQFTTLALQQQKVIQARGHTSPMHKKQLDAFAQQNMTPYALLDTIGSAWSEDVAVLGIAVDTLAQEMEMEVESKAMAGTFRFIDRLQADTKIEVYLLHSSVNAKDPMHPTLFKLKVRAR